MYMQPHRRPRKMSPTSLMPSVAMILAIVLLASPMSVAWAQDNTGHDQIHSATPTQFGIGAASVLLSIPYGAAKVTYAALGGLIGGFAYLFSAGDTDAAKAVWTPSLQGTYVLTPDHLKGDKPIQFMGKAHGEDQGQQTRSTQPIHIVVTDTR